MIDWNKLVSTLASLAFNSHVGDDVTGEMVPIGDVIRDELQPVREEIERLSLAQSRTAKEE